MVTPEEERHAWAWRFLSRCTETPPWYGSLPWLELSDDDPHKVASVLLAAEWAVLQAEARKKDADAEFVAVQLAHRASWTGSGFRPDPRIAAEVEAEWRQWVGGAA